MSDWKGKVVTALKMFGLPWLTDMCPPRTSCVQGSNTVCNRCQPPSHREESCHDTTCPLTALCTHLTWNKVDDTMPPMLVLRQKAHSEPHFPTHWWDRLTVLHTQGEVWVWQPATIISSCHYLPSHSQLCSQRQVHQCCTKHTNKHKHMCSTHKNHTALS